MSSRKISWMSTQKNQVAELHLNPPDLGPLDVTLKFPTIRPLHVHNRPTAQYADAIENAMPKLREILADNGIMLGNATVSDPDAPRRQLGRIYEPAWRLNWQAEKFPALKLCKRTHQRRPYKPPGKTPQWHG